MICAFILYNRAACMTQLVFANPDLVKQTADKNMYPNLILKKREGKRLLAGHLWIYSNEVDTQQSPLKQFTAGQLVNVASHEGRILGTAYVNASSLICARMLSHHANQKIEHSWIEAALRQALSLREALYPLPYYRLVHSEGDYLPGLIIDRFGDVFVVQTNTAGMDAIKNIIVEVLVSLFKPAGVLLKNSSSSRELENLPEEMLCAYGEVPDEVTLQENGSQFTVPLAKGQKTGWFYDHRLNRERMAQYTKEKRVLDLFSYAGGWGVQAAMAGATAVTMVDASAQAIDYANKNATQNQHSAHIDTITDDVFTALSNMVDKGRQFDVIIVDPPAFVKRKKDIESASNAYYRVNLMAAKLLAKNGILISSSCSYHFSTEMLARTLLKVAQKTSRHLQYIERLSQAPDHPVHPAIVETAYLKGFICRLG